MKIDERKVLSEFYPSGKRATTPHLVDVSPGLFVMVDGQGDPNTSERYMEAIGMIYAVSYGAKFASKALGNDYAVMPMEGLWWSDDIDAFEEERRDEWLWTLMIRHPDVAGEELLRKAVEQAAAKGKLTEKQASEVRIERFDEGLAVQALHIGPYDSEGPLIAQMHEWAIGEGFKLRDKHHEIYLGDPRRTAPEKLKTILRQPVEKA